MTRPVEQAPLNGCGHAVEMAGGLALRRQLSGLTAARRADGRRPIGPAGGAPPQRARAFMLAIGTGCTKFLAKSAQTANVDRSPAAGAGGESATVPGRGRGTDRAPGSGRGHGLQGTGVGIGTGAGLRAVQP